MVKKKAPTVPSEPSALDRLVAGLDPSHPDIPDARRRDGTAIILVAVLLLILLLPFVGKAIHVDDPFYIWVAQHIETNPGSPYGFLVNWYGTDLPVYEVNKNPPLVSYYIALAASCLGWSEPALHLAMLLPALAVAVGLYLVACRFCKRPLLATLAGVLAPVFFLSSLTVMCDMLMLAFWVFAVHFWMKGLETRNHRALALAALLIGLASLTKYFALTLIPLLATYTLLKERRAGWLLLYLLMPIVILGWYQWTMHQLYGRALLLDAVAYATETTARFGQGVIPKLGIGLVFSGGCVASALFLARQLWSWSGLLLGAVFAGLSALAIAQFPTLTAVPVDRMTHALVAFQLGVWGTVGLSLVILAALDLYQRRDADALFLLLWMLGTLVFAGFVNWTTNGRTILPMIVPAGILIARRLERVSINDQAQGAKRKAQGQNPRLPATLVPLAAAAIFSLIVTWADYRLAAATRAGVRLIQEKYGASASTMWFQGHWGFQYYMQQLGAKPLDVKNLRFRSGDVVAVPTTNSGLYPMAPQWSVREVFEVPLGSWLATMNAGIGAGFYADVFGPLPFAIGSVPMERFTVYAVAQPGR